MHVGVVSFTDVDYGLDLANGLFDAGAGVTFYSSLSHVSRMVGDANQPIQHLYKLGLLSKEVKVNLVQLSRMRNPRSFSVMNSVANMIRHDGVDIAHILLGGGEIWTSVLANFIKDIPVVSTMIIPQPNLSEYPPARIVIWVNRFLAFGSDVVIVNGKDHVQLLKDIYHYPVDRVRYIPLGPRCVSLKWSAKNLPEETGTILFLGRIHKHKGLEFLIKAQPLITKQFPNARFIIAGQGKDLERCRKLIVDPTVFDIFDDYIPGNILAEYFQKSSIVVVPYLTAATSGILMTAYVFGKPVVSTRVGSLPEYVQDGSTGILVDPGDANQLADAIIRLLSDDHLMHQMGENGAKWIREELSWKNIAAETIRAYEGAADFHRHRT